MAKMGIPITAEEWTCVKYHLSLKQTYREICDSTGISICTISKIKKSSSYKDFRKQNLEKNREIAKEKQKVENPPPGGSETNLYVTTQLAKKIDQLVKEQQTTNERLNEILQLWR